MNASANDPYARARELRAAFDGTFAVPRVPSAASATDLLLVHVADRLYGFRIDELHGLHPRRHITPVPGTDPALLGIVGLRGELVPTYSLALLLGARQDTGPSRWLVVCKSATTPVALALEDLRGSTQISEADLHAPVISQRLPAHVSRLVQLPDQICYVISTRSVVDAIESSAGTGVASAAGKDEQSTVTGR